MFGSLIVTFAWLHCMYTPAVFETVTETVGKRRKAVETKAEIYLARSSRSLRNKKCPTHDFWCGYSETVENLSDRLRQYRGESYVKGCDTLLWNGFCSERRTDGGNYCTPCDGWRKTGGRFVGVEEEPWDRSRRMRSGDLTERDLYLGPIAASSGRIIKFYYAQTTVAYRGGPKAIIAKRRTAINVIPRPTRMLVYESSVCISHRERAFNRLSMLGPSIAMGKMSWFSPRANEATNYFVKHDPSGSWMTTNDQPMDARFNLCMDKVNKPGYVTEKLVNAFAQGTIPIWYGTTEAFELFQARCVHLLRSAHPEPALRLIRHLESNRTAYDEMRARPIFERNWVGWHPEIAMKLVDAKRHV